MYSLLRDCLITLFVVCTPSLAQTQSECHGCQLFLVTYADGFYMGNSAIPGVSTIFYPGLGTNSGGCVGIDPACDGTPCVFKKGTVHIINVGAGQPIEVTNPDGSPRANLDEGEEADFPVSGAPGGEFLQCENRPRPILLIAIGDSLYDVSLLCTPCPGSDPY